MNLLFSSCGRRVELIRSFRTALDEIGGGNILACDIDHLASALQVADRKFIVPPCGDNSFIQAIAEICREEKVDAVIPLIDTELGIYAENKEVFADIGTEVIVSEPEVIGICASKLSTAAFFRKCGLPHLMTVSLEDWHRSSVIPLPAVLKPDRGSAGIGVYEVNNKDEIETLSRRISYPIIQERAMGKEVTVDCLVDRSGSLVRYVARERLEIRAGESSKGRTFKDKELGRLLEGLCARLGAFGPITIQCFRDGGNYVFSEINPRFGGGYPLAQAAGADFPRLLVSILMGEKIEVDMDGYKENMYMTRYDQAFYLVRDNAGSLVVL